MAQRRERYSAGDVVRCVECGTDFTLREENIFVGLIDKYISCPACNCAHSFYMYDVVGAVNKFSKKEEKQDGKTS